MLHYLFFQCQFWLAHAAKIWAIVLSVVFWNPCVDQPAKPFALPNWIQVDAIEMRCRSGKQSTIRRIDGVEKIERFLTFMERLDAGWKIPWKQCPTPEYAFEAKGEGLSIVHFAVSPKHITVWSDYDFGPTRYRDLSDEEWLELAAILEIEEGFKQFDNSVIDNERNDKVVVTATITRHEPGHAPAWSWERRLAIFAGMATTYLLSFLLVCAGLGVIEEPERWLPVIRLAYYPLIISVRMLFKT